MKSKFVLALVLLIPFTGCEMVDNLIPSMPFNTPANLDNPADPLNPDNTVGPMAVTDISGTSTPTTVNLSWKTPIDVDQSFIRINWSPTGGQTQPVTVNNSVPEKLLSTVITGLTPNTTYTFTIVAVDDDARTGVSATFTIKTALSSDVTPPGPVSGVTAAARDTSVLLNWTKPSDTDYQDVEVTWSPQGSSAQPVYFTGTSGTVTGLINGTTYTFTLKARDTNGNRSTGVTVIGTPVGTTLVWQQELLNITSPNYPSEYPSNANFTREIRKTGAAKIRIRFSAFNTEDDFDEVVLKDGTGAVVQTLSGNLGSFTSVDVAGEVIQLTFTSDGTFQYSGWKIDQMEFQMPVQSGEDVEFNGGAYDLLIPVSTNTEWQIVRFENEPVVWMALEVETAGLYSFRMSDLKAGLGGETLDAKVSLLDNSYNVVGGIDKIDSVFTTPRTATLSTGTYWLKIQTFNEAAQTGYIQLQAVLPQGGS